MFVNPELWNQVGPSAMKAAVGLIITGLLGVIMWPIKRASKEWKALKEEQASIHQELVKQRENCLTTLQAQGATMIGLQSKTVDILGEIRVSQAEMVGYLKAGAIPLRRRTAKK